MDFFQNSGCYGNKIKVIGKMLKNLLIRNHWSLEVHGWSIGGADGGGPVFHILLHRNYSNYSESFSQKTTY